MMHPCDYCGQTVAFGGVLDRSLRFCKMECAQAHLDIEEVPDEEVEVESMLVHEGPCPVCEGPGPVDAHLYYTIYSIVLATYSNKSAIVSCQPCGRNKQISSILLSLFFGWWGIPWGILMTPVQVFRNLTAMKSPPPPRRPSRNLKEQVRLALSGSE